MRDLIRREFGKEIAIRTISAYMKRWNMTPQRPKKKALQQDPVAVVSGRVNVNRFGHLKVNIRTCKSEQKSEHISCVRTTRSVAIKGRRPSALRAFTPPLAAVEARGAGEPGPFELRLCGPFPCRKVVAA